MEFSEVSSPAPLHYLIERALHLSEVSAGEGSRLLILAGRSRRLAVENHLVELKTVLEEHGGVGSEVKRTVGDVTTALVVSGCQASMIVFQAALAQE